MEVITNEKQDDVWLRSRPRLVSAVYDIMLALDGIVSTNMMHDMLLSTEKSEHFVPNRFFATPQFCATLEESMRQASLQDFLKESRQSHAPPQFVLPYQYRDRCWALFFVALRETSVILGRAQEQAFCYFYVPFEADTALVAKQVDTIRRIFAPTLGPSVKWCDQKNHQIQGLPNQAHGEDAEKSAFYVYTAVRILRTYGLSFHSTSGVDSVFYAPVQQGSRQPVSEMQRLFSELHTGDMRVILSDAVMQSLINDKGDLGDKFAWIERDYRTHYRELVGETLYRYLEAWAYLLCRHGYDENVYGFTVADFLALSKAPEIRMQKFFQRYQFVEYRKDGFFQTPRLEELLAVVQVLPRHSYFPKTYVFHANQTEPSVLFMADDQLISDRDNEQVALMNLLYKYNVDAVRALNGDQTAYEALEDSLHKSRPWSEEDVRRDLARALIAVTKEIDSLSGRDRKLRSLLGGYYDRKDDDAALRALEVALLPALKRQKVVIDAIEVNRILKQYPRESPVGEMEAERK